MNTELELIEEVGAVAWTMVMEGEYQSAKRTLGKIRHSAYINESERVIAIVEAKILQESKRVFEARERILDSIGFLWGRADAFEILAAANPETDDCSKLYQIEILGGAASVGVFLQFSEKHLAKFDVIANSEEEAIKYIESICKFAKPEARDVRIPNIKIVDRERHPRRGILHAYPFSIPEQDKSS